MAKSDWEQKFNTWSVGPSKTETEKTERAEAMVKEAIASHSGLSGHTIQVFAQGSYRNRTNVRLDSDVDVCVLYTDAFITDYSHAPGASDSSLGFTDSNYGFADLKRDVKAALVAKFGSSDVTAGDKAFDIKDNTYRVAADVVPTFEGRLYYKTASGGYGYRSGTVLQSASSGQRIWNYPQQHYDNGVAKHSDTKRQFKKKARCLKNLSNRMTSDGNANAEKMASFLLESLVYNCSDSAFNQDSQYADMKVVIRELWNATKKDDACSQFTEVNGLKYLFHPDQPWDRETVHAFLLDAWSYVGFGDE